MNVYIEGNFKKEFIERFKEDTSKFNINKYYGKLSEEDVIISVREFDFNYYDEFILLLNNMLIKREIKNFIIDL